MQVHWELWGVRFRYVDLWVCRRGLVDSMGTSAPLALSQTPSKAIQPQAVAVYLQMSQTSTKSLGAVNNMAASRTAPTLGTCIPLPAMRTMGT